MRSLFPSFSSYLSSHWRGELPLGRSFWGGGVAVTLLCLVVILLALLSLWPWVDQIPLTSIIAIKMALFAFAIMVSVWQYVGIWRSAGHYHGRKIWKYGARLMVLLCTISSLPDLKAVADSIEADFTPDPIGQYTLSQPDDHTLLIYGWLPFGISDDVASTLAKKPSITRVQLDSPGGRLHEGLKLGKLIKKHKLNTYVKRGCFSACTVAFAGGAKREMDESASFGFHAPIRSADLLHTTEYEPAFSMQLLQYREFAFMREQGIGTAFITKLQSLPYKPIWKPDTEQLRSAGYITGISGQAYE